MKNLILLFVMLFTFICYAQEEALDKMELRDGTIYLGKVEKVKTDAVEFKEKETGLIYESLKTTIRYIQLATGKILTFDAEVQSTTETGPTQTQPVVEQDSGSSTGLIILAAVGGTLALLLLIGAIASAGD